MGAELIVIVLSAILTENFVLSRFLGICPFLGVSKRMSTAFGMSLAVLFVMSVASVVTWALEFYVLVPLELEYLRTIVFILVIAGLVQLTEMAILRLSSTLYEALGIYLPLITTNCAVLGLAVLNIQRGYDDVLRPLVNGIGAAVGFGLALMIFSGIRERIELADVPDVFKGSAIALVTAGILSLAFMGFSGLVPAN